MCPRLFFCAIGAMLCACSIHPLPEDFAGLPTAGIVHKIRCEAKTAILKHLGRNDDYANGGIGYDFSFTMTETNNIGAGATFEFPFVSKFGTFGTDVAAGRDRKRETERKFIIAETFEELERLQGCLKDDRENWTYPITGRIGLDEVVRTYFVLDRGGTELRSFSDQLSFTTTIGGSIKPSVELNPLAGQLRLTEASGSLVANRTDVHKVRIVIAQKLDQLDDQLGAGGGGGKKGRGAEIKERIYQELYQQRPQEFKLIQ
jgi:hypothetical protein